MNKTILLACCLLMTVSMAAGQDAVPQRYVPTADNVAARREFEGFRFGIFLHWGIYSEFAQGEWYLNAGLQQDEYAKAASCFYPVLFDAREWVRAIRESGARYVTFTSRHHDGFSMWHTRESTYNIVDATPFRRDVVGELAQACREEGIRLHLYYSLLDWMRTDYPIGRTGRRTGRTLTPDYEAYFWFMKRQVNELLTGYDGVQGIWLDGYWDHDQDSIPFDWRMEEFYRYIHTLKPACLIGNNHHVAPIDGEDFQMFERDLPGENKAGLSGQEVSQLPLEMCETMNGMWGYKVADQDYKSSRELINLLVRAAAKGSNLLLNIGPQPNGQLPATALERLRDIGQWMRQYGESVYGTQRGEQYQWGVTTRRAPTDGHGRAANGGTIYLHVMADACCIDLPLARKPRSVVRLGDHTPLPFQYNRRHHTLTVERVSQYDVVEIRE